MSTIQVNDIKMYYEIHGQGETLILIAGFGADHTVWATVIDQLKEHYQVIVFDNRGAGQTNVPEGPYSIELLTDDVAELCKQLNIKQAHFVGNSMGGFILQTLAYRHADLVKSAVISNSACTAQSPFLLYAAAQLELIKAQAPVAALTQASCCWAFSFQFLSQPGVLDNLIQLRLNNPYPFILQGYEGQYAAISAFNSKDWANQITAPTLVFGGDKDIIFDEALTRTPKNEIPNAQYFCFKDCGHLPHIEYPDQFVKTIKHFIEENVR